jgi:hypothetical protein
VISFNAVDGFFRKNFQSEFSSRNFSPFSLVYKFFPGLKRDSAGSFISKDDKGN